MSFNINSHNHLFDVVESINPSITHRHAEAFGKDFVTNLAMEESAELIQAISKVKRYPDDSDREDNLAEEICDVLLMIEELFALELADPMTVDRWITKKQRKQKEEIDKKTAGSARHRVTFY